MKPLHYRMRMRWERIIIHYNYTLHILNFDWRLKTTHYKLIIEENLMTYDSLGKQGCNESVSVADNTLIIPISRYIKLEKYLRETKLLSTSPHKM